MSSRFLQPSFLFSALPGEGKKYFLTRPKSIFNFYSSFETPKPKMPVIPAVIAHSRHHFCQHAALAHSHSHNHNNSMSSTAYNNKNYNGLRSASIDLHSPCPPPLYRTTKRGLSLFGTLNHLSMDLKASLLISSSGTNESRRFYSKSKDRPKSAKKNVVVNEEEMSEVIDVKGFKGQLEALITHMKDDYTKQLSVRGAAGALETLEVEFEGEVYPLQELAQVGRKNPQLAVLNLASLPDACQPVLKAIQDCGMNLNPQQEGTTIYVPLPKVTREHRENLAKGAKVIFTKYKTSLQGVQNRYAKQCKSPKDISEDLAFSVLQQVMKLTENYILEAEKLMQAKQKELLDSN